MPKLTGMSVVITGASGPGRWTMKRMLGLPIVNARAQRSTSGGLFAPGRNGGVSGHLPLDTVAGPGAAAVLARRR